MKSMNESATNENKTVLITGSARRLGKGVALAVAAAGYPVIIHTSHSYSDAENLVSQIIDSGGKAKFISADFSIPEKANEIFINTFANEENLFALINNASIFESGNFIDTSYESWQNHFAVNLTTPYLISQAFAKKVGENPGRIINILDWRVLRPGKDHFSYTISKSALATMTKAMALALAPNIIVNGLALGAILPPSDGSTDPIIRSVPLGRWAKIREVTETILFLLAGPEFITGEIIHVDGGRHLV